MQLLLIVCMVSTLLSNVVALSIPAPSSAPPHPHSPVHQPFSKACIKCYNICHNTFMKCAFVCHNSFSLYCEVSHSRRLLCSRVAVVTTISIDQLYHQGRGALRTSQTHTDKYLCRSTIGLHRDRTIHLRSLPSLLASLPPSGEPRDQHSQHDYASRSTANAVEHIIEFWKKIQMIEGAYPSGCKSMYLFALGV